MIFHENLLLADDSHVISYLIFVENRERCHKICLPSAAVVNGAFRVKRYDQFYLQDYFYYILLFTDTVFRCHTSSSYDHCFYF